MNLTGQVIMAGEIGGAGPESQRKDPAPLRFGDYSRIQTEKRKLDCYAEPWREDGGERMPQPKPRPDRHGGHPRSPEAKGDADRPWSPKRSGVG